MKVDERGTEAAAAIEKDGPAAAQERFVELLKSGRADDYTMDERKLTQLMQTYVQAGQIERMQVIVTVMGEYSTAAARAESLPGGTPQSAPAERTASRSEPGKTGEEAVRARLRERLGEGRTDLERFFGYYGVAPDGQNGTRMWLVSASCEGYLMVAPMWADVQEWLMRSTGDATFEYPGDSFTQAVHFTITTGAGGRGAGLKMDYEGFTEPMVRIRDLDPEFRPQCDAR